jgi:hypothetical protein
MKTYPMAYRSCTKHLFWMLQRERFGCTGDGLRCRDGGAGGAGGCFTAHDPYCAVAQWSYV